MARVAWHIIKRSALTRAPSRFRSTTTRDERRAPRRVFASRSKQRASFSTCSTCSPSSYRHDGVAHDGYESNFPNPRPSSSHHLLDRVRSKRSLICIRNVPLSNLKKRKKRKKGNTIPPSFSGTTPFFLSTLLRYSPGSVACPLYHGSIVSLAWGKKILSKSRGNNGGDRPVPVSKLESSLSPIIDG